jgi:hypothetical protein
MRYRDMGVCVCVWVCVCVSSREIYIYIALYTYVYSVYWINNLEEVSFVSELSCLR